MFVQLTSIAETSGHVNGDETGLLEQSRNLVQEAKNDLERMKYRLDDRGLHMIGG
jgi:hypothetical protein